MKYIYIYIIFFIFFSCSFEPDKICGSKLREFRKEKGGKMGACKAPPISRFLLSTNTPQNRKTPIPTRQKSNPNSPNRRSLLISTTSLVVLLLPPPTPSSALPIFDPVSPNERAASAEVSRRVSEAVDLLEKGRALQAQGDFQQALQYFTQVRISSSSLCVPFGFREISGKL